MINSLYDIPVKTCEWLLEWQRERVIKRTFCRPRKSKGGDYKLPGRMIPSKAVYIMDGFIVCHPDMLERLRVCGESSVIQKLGVK